MFSNYGHPLVPGIGSLDNFYAKQLDDGEICREIDRTSGREFEPWVNRERSSLRSRWGVIDGPGAKPFAVTYVGREPPLPHPYLTLDALNHPIFAWAEMESVRVTGDRARLAMVYQPLLQYYQALQRYIRQGNGLYMTDWASMDNSPRNAYLVRGGTAVDTSAQMVLFARQLAEIADLVGKPADAASFRREADDLARTINEKMWNLQRKFYFDLTVDGRQSPVKTIAAFWTLLAGVAAGDRVDALAAELENPKSFCRKHRVPTLPAGEAGFDPAGGYWRGSVWAPTNTMIVRGLEHAGRRDLARRIALEHLDAVAEVFRQTNTVWENYAADSIKPGNMAKPDFVGWAGIVPILYFLEYSIGLLPDALSNRLTWTLTSPKRTGCDRYRFAGHTVTLLAEPDPARPGRLQITVESDGAFTLQLVHGAKRAEFSVKQGKNVFLVE